MATDTALTDLLVELLNAWLVDSVGYKQDAILITRLNDLCKEHGYGRIYQLVSQIEDIWRHPSKIPQYKKARAERVKLVKESTNLDNQRGG